MGGLGEPVHRDELKFKAVLILCIFKSTNVNLKLSISIYLLPISLSLHSLIRSSVPPLRRSGGPDRPLHTPVGGSTRWQKAGSKASPTRPRAPAVSAVPNSGGPATCSRQPMGRTGGGRGGARLQKAAREDTAPRTRSREARAEAAELQTRSAWRPGGRGAMLRVRCLRGGSRGAEALHYIGSRVRAPSPRRPAAYSPRLLPSLSPASFADRVLSGPRRKPRFKSLRRLRELGGVAGEGGRALGPHPVDAGAVWAGGAALPSQMGVGWQATPLREEGWARGWGWRLRALGGQRGGQASGADGREKGRKVARGQRGSEQARSKCNMESWDARGVGASSIFTRISVRSCPLLPWYAGTRLQTLPSSWGWNSRAVWLPRATGFRTAVTPSCFGLQPGSPPFSFLRLLTKIWGWGEGEVCPAYEGLSLL